MSKIGLLLGSQTTNTYENRNNIMSIYFYPGPYVIIIITEEIAINP